MDTLKQWAGVAHEFWAQIPGWVWLALYVAWLAYAIIFMLSQRRSPQATQAWLMAFITIPVLSVVAYFVFGPRRLRRRRMRRSLAKRIMGRVARSKAPELDPKAGPHESWVQQRLRSLALAISSLDQPPPRQAVSARLLIDGEATYGAIEHAFTQARDHIHLEYYIYDDDDVGRRWRDALCERARAGIEVRVIVDAVGSHKAGGRFWKPLVEAGGEVRQFNQPRVLRPRPGLFNFRSHRKIVVIDGILGYTGGINVSGTSYLSGSGGKHWRDTHMEIVGPPVADLQMIFLEDWLFSGNARDLRKTAHNEARQEALEQAAVEHWFPAQPAADGPWTQVVSSGPDAVHSATHRLFFTAMTMATERLWITTPYFIPDEPIMTALAATAARGVDVRVLLPSKGDSRIVAAAASTFAEEIARMGVKVYSYTERMLHAKTIVVDDQLAIVGTANMDNRSFRLNFEVSLCFYDQAVNAEMAEVFLKDQQGAHELTRRDRENAFVPRLMASAARLFAPLL